MILTERIWRELLIAFVLLVISPVIVLTDVCCGKNYSANIAIAIRRIETSQSKGDMDDESTD